MKHTWVIRMPVNETNDLEGVTLSLDTLPKLLISKASLYGNRKVALREKEYGIWQLVNWQEYLEHVKYLALGMAGLGFKRGDKVAIIGDNRPEWIYAELAAQSLGGVSVGIYQDSLSKEVSYVIDHSDAIFLVVEDQEQVDKLLEIKAQTPKVKRIIYFDSKGLRNYNDPLLMDFVHLEALGRKFESNHSGYFESELARGQGEDPAIICYTSGTTGFPKGAVLCHRNLITMAQNLLSVDPLTDRNELISFLPLAWIGEQMMSLSLSLMVGATVNFPEEPETVAENIREIGPHIIFSPPRIWEDIVSKVQVMIEDSCPLKRFFYRFLMPVGYRMADHKFNRTVPPLGLRILYALGELLIYSAIKDRFGLVHIKRAYTGGAALGPDVFRFYHALGVNLKQIYGQTEISGLSVIHRDDDIQFHSVGKPIPGTEVRIAENGEILSKSASVFNGYYKNEKASEETLADGWLHSGDAGYIDDKGHLVVIDRLKDVMCLADGQIFSPQFIENRLKFSMFIKEAVVIGKDRPYVVAMINIDFSNTGKWAENNHLAYTTYADLSQKAEILEMIRLEVGRVNKELPEAAQIKKFVLLHKELDADDEELTRTKKVRRGYVYEKYIDLIQGLYSDASRIKVEGKVRYRDGREAIIQTDLLVVSGQMEVA